MDRDKERGECEREEMRKRDCEKEEEKEMERK